MPSLETPTDLLTQFEENGYVVIPDFIAPPELKRIFRQIEDLVDVCLKSQKVSLSQFKSLDEKYLYLKANFPIMKSRAYDLIKQTDALWAVAVSEKTMSLVRKLAGDTTVVDKLQVRIDDKSDDRLLPFHQEVFGQMSQRSISVWAPMIDLNEKNGPLQIVKNSHKRGQVPHKFHAELNNYHGVSEKVNLADIKKIILSKGTALIFHNLLFHASSPNQTDQIRWTFNCRFNDISKIPYLQSAEAPPHIPQV